jgi:hypothetical protein
VKYNGEELNGNKSLSGWIATENVYVIVCACADARESSDMALRYKRYIQSPYHNSTVFALPVKLPKQYRMDTKIVNFSAVLYGCETWSPIREQ